ncbi:MAG: hypothetical protein QXM16_03250 [Nitrososphaerota archaeon]
MKRGALLFDKRQGKTYRTRKNLYYLYITAPSWLKFYELVGFTIMRKKAKTRKLPEEARTTRHATQPTLLHFSLS